MCNTVIQILAVRLTSFCPVPACLQTVQTAATVVSPGPGYADQFPAVTVGMGRKPMPGPKRPSPEEIREHQHREKMYEIERREREIEEERREVRARECVMFVRQVATSWIALRSFELRVLKDNCVTTSYASVQ